MTSQRSKTRVNISNENAPVLESLGELAGPASVFQNQAKALVFAASVGYHFNQYEPAASQTKKAIHFEQIDRATDLGGDLDAVFALARVRDISVLAQRDGESEPGSEESVAEDSVAILEGYVNGGLSYIRKQDFDRAKPIEAVLALVRTLDPEGSGIFSRS